MVADIDIAALRERIASLERGQRNMAARPPMPLGEARIDAALPGGGLAAGALHEVFGGSAGDDAAAGFALLLLARFARDGRLVLWCRNRAASRRQDLPPISPYAPGLAALGLDPGRLLLVHATRDVDTLWAMEEALRETAFAAVLGEVGEIGLSGGRRLQLAAEAHGVTALLLRPGRADPAPTAAVTRWQATARPATAGGQPVDGLPMDSVPVDSLPVDSLPVWRLDLLRCRGGRPGSWLVARDRDLLLPADPAPPSSCREPPYRELSCRETGS